MIMIYHMSWSLRGGSDAKGGLPRPRALEPHSPLRAFPTARERRAQTIKKPEISSYQGGPELKVPPTDHNPPGKVWFQRGPDIEMVLATDKKKGKSREERKTSSVATLGGPR